MENINSFIKKSGLFLATGSLLLFSFSTITQPGQPVQANVTITLHVDTGNIDNKNTATTCDFGQDEGISNEDFTVAVNVGDIITWEGVSSSSPSTDVVEITKIKYVKGKNIFGKDLGPGNNRKITGKALSSTATEGDYKYDISFTVTNNGAKRNGTFHIDPVIQVH